MEISETMLDSAMRKATEAGLFPRRATPGETAINRALMRSVLEAFVDAAHLEMTEQELADMLFDENRTQAPQAKCFRFS